LYSLLFGLKKEFYQGNDIQIPINKEQSINNINSINMQKKEFEMNQIDQPKPWIID
jgi:hypothetical protein